MARRSIGCNFTFALLLALGACGAPNGAQEAQDSPSVAQSAAAKAPAWTTEFQASSTLVAREVLIEGPPGLIAHVAFKQQPEQHYTAKTTSEGFLQEVTVENQEGELIRVQLDNMAIAAELRIRVLERVVECPLRVHASGDVFWKNLVSGQESRTEVLDFSGARP